MANDVEVRFRGEASDLKNALTESQDLVGQWAGRIKTLVGAVAAGFAIKKGLDIVGGLIGEVAAAEAAQKKLEAVVKATGGAAGYSADQMTAFADEMQRMTGIEAEVIMQSEAVIGTFKNIRGDVFLEANRAAADMAAVLGGDAASAAMQLGKALNDPTEGLNALKRAGVSFTDQQKDQIKALQEAGRMADAQRMILAELSAEFGGAALANAESFSGQWTIMTQRIGECGEAIVGALLPAMTALNPAIDFLVGAVEGLTEMMVDSFQTQTDYSQEWSKVFVASAKYVVDGLLNAFSFIEFLYENTGAIILRQGLAWGLSIVEFGEDVKHVFTTVIPAYYAWFLRNADNIVKDWVQLHLIAFENLLTNAENFMKALMGYFNGEGFKFEFVALTEGFRATMEALPEIASREISDLEKSLKSEMDAVEQNMADSWTKIWDKNAKMKAKARKGAEPEKIDMTANTKPFEKEVAKAEEKAKKTKVEKDLTAKTGDDQNKDTQAGSSTALEELARSIQAATFAGPEEVKAISEKNNNDVVAALDEAAKKDAAAIAAPAMANDKAMAEARAKLGKPSVIAALDEAGKASVEVAKPEDTLSKDLQIAEETARTIMKSDASSTEPPETQVIGLDELVKLMTDMVETMKAQHPETISALKSVGVLV